MGYLYILTIYCHLSLVVSQNVPKAEPEQTHDDYFFMPLSVANCRKLEHFFPKIVNVGLETDGVDSDVENNYNHYSRVLDFMFEPLVEPVTKKGFEAEKKRINAALTVATMRRYQRHCLRLCRTTD